MAKYILNPGATGDIHTAPLLKKDGDKAISKTKFELDKPESLDQTDLEYLFENQLTNQIIKVETPIVDATPDKAVKQKAAKPDEVK